MVRQLVHKMGRHRKRVSAAIDACVIDTVSKRRVGHTRPTHTHALGSYIVAMRERQGDTYGGARSIWLAWLIAGPSSNRRAYTPVYVDGSWRRSWTPTTGPWWW